MSLLGGFRSDQLIQQLVAEKDPTSAGAHKLVGKIKKIGPKVIPKVIDALAMSDKSHTMVFVDILSSLVNDKTTTARGSPTATSVSSRARPGRCAARLTTTSTSCSTGLTTTKSRNRP